MSLENVRQILSMAGNRHIQSIFVVVLSYAGARIVAWGVARLLSRVGRRTGTPIDDELIGMLHRPIFTTVLLTGVAVALTILQPPHPFGFIGFGLIKTLVVAVWLGFFIQSSALLLRWMAEQPKRFSIVQPITLSLFEIAAKLVLIGGAVYFVLISWKVDVTGWLVSGSIIGIALGFAARDTLSNLFAGVFILADTPYRVGDFIILEKGERGRVTKIGLRSTRMVTGDDIEITIPNSIIANSRIINESRPIIRQRMHIPVGVAYGSDIDQVREILRKRPRPLRRSARSPNHECA